jgi:hypothetical protein
MLDFSIKPGVSKTPRINICVDDMEENGFIIKEGTKTNLITKEEGRWVDQGSKYFIHINSDDLANSSSYISPLFTL